MAPRRGTRRKRRGQRGGSAHHTAVIVEPRKMKALQYVLPNVLANLDPAKWNVLIFHGTANKEWLDKLIDTHCPAEKGRISFESLGKENLTEQDYNTLLTSREFYEKIPGEMILIFQADTLICNKNLLEPFMKYDYVGAPWSWRKGGNGGLSLRRKSRMIEMVTKCPRRFDNEDGYFSRGCAAVPISIPSTEEAKKFAIETVDSPDSFGLHSSWKWVHGAGEAAIRKRCPSYDAIKSAHQVLNDA